MPDDDSLDALTDRLNAAYPYGHEALGLRSMIKLYLWLMRQADKAQSSIPEMQQMPDDMVERVAKAIYNADDTNTLAWEVDTKEWERNDYRNLARAAIEAMREATEAMLGKRIEEAERIYRSAEDSEFELYLQGRWEEAQHVASAIRNLAALGETETKKAGDLA